MTTTPSNPRRFSDTYSTHWVSETDYETMALSALNHYGIHAERGLVVIKWDEWKCDICGWVVEELSEPVFVRNVGELKATCIKHPNEEYLLAGIVRLVGAYSHDHFGGVQK